MKYTELINELDSDFALKTFCKLSKEKNQAVRELLLQLAEPAAEISRDNRIKNAIRVGYEYLREEADAEALAQAQAIAESAAYSAENYLDQKAAFAVVEALVQDSPRLAEHVKQVAQYAAQAIAHYKASKPFDYYTVYQEALTAHQKQQYEMLRNWLENQK